MSGEPLSRPGDPYGYPRTPSQSMVRVMFLSGPHHEKMSMLPYNLVSKGVAFEGYPLGWYEKIGTFYNHHLGSMNNIIYLFRWNGPVYPYNVNEIPETIG